MTAMASHPISGPHDTVVSTPALAVGAARRTMSTDVARPNGFAGDTVIRVHGRDIRGTTAIEEVDGELIVEPVGGTITTVAMDGAPDVVGLSLRRGWLRATSDALGDERSLTDSLLRTSVARFWCRATRRCAPG